MTSDNQVIMRMDNTTWLPNNGLRDRYVPPFTHTTFDVNPFDA